jgi:hypothetical protein
VFAYLQAQLEHRIADENSENQETAPTEIDIEQTIRKCEGGELVLIAATITGKYF